MSLLRDDQIQAGLISYLKSKAAITIQIPSASEIHEDQWQGTEFEYPNIRVRMVSNRPGEIGCPQEIEVGFQVLSEEDSSQEADTIAGTIADILHGRGFNSNNIHYSLVVSNLIPAFRVDLRTWRSECLMRGSVSG